MLDVSDLRAVELKYRGKGLGRFMYFSDTGEPAARQCKSCDLVKRIEEYSYSASHGKRKYKSYCKPCNSVKSYKWNQDNPERANASAERYVSSLKGRTPLEVESDKLEMYPTGAKACSHCSETLPIGSFYPDVYTRGGLSSRCVGCTYASSRAWAVENPERIRELDRQMRIRFNNRSPEALLVDQMRIHPSGKKRCKACKEFLPFINFYRNGIRYDGISARCGSCTVKHNSMSRRQRRPKYWVSRGIPIECYICGDDFEEVEHVVPLALDGLDVDENTLPACVVCNRSKNDTPLEIFVQGMPDPAAILARVDSYGVRYVVG